MAKLEEYRRKRRFDRTPEPSGEPDAAEAEVPKAKKREIPSDKIGTFGRPRKADPTQAMTMLLVAGDCRV